MWDSHDKDQGSVYLNVASTRPRELVPRRPPALKELSLFVLKKRICPKKKKQNQRLPALKELSGFVLKKKNLSSGPERGYLDSFARGSNILLQIGFQKRRYLCAM